MSLSSGVLSLWLFGVLCLCAGFGLLPLASIWILFLCRLRLFVGVHVLVVFLQLFFFSQSVVLHHIVVDSSLALVQCMSLFWHSLWSLPVVSLSFDLYYRNVNIDFIQRFCFNVLGKNR